MSEEQVNPEENNDDLLLLEVPAFAASVKRAINTINAMEASKREQLGPELEQLKAFHKHLNNADALTSSNFQKMLVFFSEQIVPTIKDVASQQPDNAEAQMARFERGVMLAESLSQQAQSHLRQAVEIATIPLQALGQNLFAIQQHSSEPESPVDLATDPEPHLYGEGGIYEFGYPDRNGPVVVRVKHNGPNLYSADLILGDAAITAHANDPAKAVINVGEQLKAWIETLADSFAINEVTVREVEEDEDLDS